MKKEALQFLSTAIQKSPKLDDEIHRNILFHIRTQIGYNPKDAIRSFIFFLKYEEKYQISSEENNSIIQSIIDILPDNLKTTIRNVVRKQF